MTNTPVKPGRIPAIAAWSSGLILLIFSWYKFSLITQLLGIFSASLGKSDFLFEYYLTGQTVVGGGLFASGLTCHLCPGLTGRFVSLLTRSSPQRFPVWVACISLLFSFFVQFQLFDNIPHVTDAISHDFQARIMLAGKTYADIPPCHEAFFQHHIIMTSDGKWFSKYTPGHPLFLWLGYKAGVPFFPVACSHALTILSLYFLVRRFHNDTTAKIAIILFASSPLATLLSASFMSHSSFIFMAITGSCFLVKSFDTGKVTLPGRGWLYAIPGGLFWGWAFITRPQDAVIGGLVVIALCILNGRGQYTDILKTGLRALPGLLPPLLLYAYWNHQQYGAWLAIGYGFTQEQTITRIYQASFGLSEHFTIKDACRLMMYTLYRFDRVALGWPTSLLFCLPALSIFRLNRLDISCALACIIHAGVYFFYDYYGLEFEARYYFNLLPFVVVLIARSLLGLASISTPLKSGAIIVVGTFFIHNVLHFWPTIITPHYGPDYEQASRSLHQQANATGLANALVLVPSDGDDAFRYSSGMLFNDPWLEGNIIYARALDNDSVECLKTSFPDRAIYIAMPDQEWRNITFKRIE